MDMKSLLFVAITSLVFSQTSFSAELTCEKNNHAIDFNTQSVPLKNKLLEVQTASVEFSSVTCKHLDTDYLLAIGDTNLLMAGASAITGLREIHGELLAHVFPENDNRGDILFENSNELVKTWKEQKTRVLLYTADFPNIPSEDKGKTACHTSDRPKTCTYEFYINNKLLKIVVAKDDEPNLFNRQLKHCSALGYTDCLALYKDIRSAITPYQYHIGKAVSNTAYKRVKEVQGMWTNYNDNSRDQTFVDVVFTTLWMDTFHDDYFTGKSWSEPPPYQMFFLHPALVIDHFDHGNKGDKTNVSLAIEWVGFNVWDAYIPWGASITSIYSDRETGKSVGIGGSIHINNSFSFGMVNRGGGDNSIFINLELSDWFGTQETKFKQYEDKINTKIKDSVNL